MDIRHTARNNVRENVQGKKTLGSPALLLSALCLLSAPALADHHTSDVSYDEVKKETKELISKIGDYTNKQREEAITATRKALEDLDSRIDALESRVDNNWDELSEPAKKELRESLRALRKQRNEVAEWYGSLKQSTQSSWNELKEDFSGAYKELYEGWEDAVEAFSEQKDK